MSGSSLETRGRRTPKETASGAGAMTLWSKWGQRGTDGDGVEYVFARTANESTVPTITNNDQYTDGGGNVHKYTDDDFCPMTSVGRATDDPQGVSDIYRCEWVAMRVKGAPNAQGERAWLPYDVNSQMKLWSKYALDGDTIVLAPSLLALSDDGTSASWYSRYYTDIKIKKADDIISPYLIDHVWVYNDQDQKIYEATAEEYEIGEHGGVYSRRVNEVYSDPDYPIMFRYILSIATTDPYGQPRIREGNFLEVTRCTSLAADSGYFRVEVSINHENLHYEYPNGPYINPSPVSGSSSLSYAISHATDTLYGQQSTDAVPLTVGSTTKDIFTQGSKAANTVLAAPNGSAGNAVFRALVEADIPTLSTSKISGLGTAATRGVATTIGPSITNLVPGSLLYSVLGDSFDSSNSVKDFINSSIATATADYKNNYNVVSDLGLAYNATHSAIEAALGQTISGADNNDYCFVEIPTSESDPTQLARIERYKYNGTSWAYEYVLNNSSFTSAQWAAINSGITLTQVSLISGLNTRVGVLEARINWDNYFGIDNDGNIYVKKINENTPRGFYSFGFVTAGGVGTGGGGGGGGDLDVNTMYINLANGQGTDPLYYTREINVSHLHEFWKSLQNNDIVSTYNNYKIALAHIPDDDRLSYVDPESGEEITIDDPGTTGTVLWGAESANQVALDVNGVSKTLVKMQALDGIRSSITTILGYFSGGAAYNALALEGHNSSYFATATGLNNLATTVGSLVMVNTIGGKSGTITLGSGLQISNSGELSVVNQGTVTGVKRVGDADPFTPDANGTVTIPAYPTALPNAYALTVGNKSYNGSEAVSIDKSDIGLGNVTNDAQVKRIEMGAASGVATLGSDGKIPSSQLPSYVDDVLEYASLSAFPATGESGKIYVALDTNKTYRWSGTTYVEISPSVVIGTTTGTAFDGGSGYSHVTNGDIHVTATQKTNWDTIYGYFSDGVLGLSHIPLDDRLSYVDPEEGEEITIDDPGTTGTVLWGAESANNVALDVNGVSKTLVKQAAMDGVYSSISTLSALIGTKQDYISDLSSIRSNASLGATAYGWGDHRTYGYLTSVPTASAQTLGVVKVGNGLRIDDGVLSVTGQTQGTVTRVYVGSTAYNPDTDGYVTLPLYAFGTDGTDYVPITIGSTTKNVLTAHQTLPTALKNPYKLTWGTNNEYDGSSAVTITAAQLGALTSHQTVTLASGTNNGTLKITTAAGTTDNVAVTGLGTAAYRGVATTIGSSITNLVPGSLLYSVLGDSFDATNNVKAFINSSIATATATYRGNYNVVSDLGGHYNDSDATIASEIATKLASLSITPDDNDYCFVEIPTSDESDAPIAVTKRFKYNGTAWGYEYSLNNSGFTQAQWNALNSGITSTLVAAFNAKYDKPAGGIPKEHLDSSVQTSLGKADTALQPAWTGSQNITTLGTITTGVWHGSAIAQDYLDDIGWVFVRNAATYDTEDYIHVN